jgi:hypothetical protein
MAIAYKSKVFSNSAANTSQALFTAVASNTLVKSIICNNDGKTTGTATLRINESGGTSKLIRRVTIASGDTSVELLYDVLALEAGDILYVTSTDTDITFIMSYAEDSESLALQSIDVLSDVNTTGKADGDVLTWDNGTSNWVASTPDQIITTLNGLTDVTISDPVDHDALVYDEATSQWVNGEPKALDMPVYNGTGAVIAKGGVLKAVGAHGDKVSVGLFALGVDSPKYLVGLAAEQLAIGAVGHARVYGELRGINTNAYPIGTILYASSTAGGFTTTAPFPEIPLATVIRQQQNTGRLMVRTWTPGGGGGGTAVSNPTTITLANTAYTIPVYAGKQNYLMLPPQANWTITPGSLGVSINTATSPNSINLTGTMAGRTISGTVQVSAQAFGTSTIRTQVLNNAGATPELITEFNSRLNLGANVFKLSFTMQPTVSPVSLVIAVTPSPTMAGNVHLSALSILA